MVQKARGFMSRLNIVANAVMQFVSFYLQAFGLDETSIFVYVTVL